jgi:hypothetical protein
MPPIITSRPFGFSGGTVPMAQARWIAINPIDGIEIIPQEEGTPLRGVWLVSGSQRMKTYHQGALTVGPSKTIDGHETMFALPRHVWNEIVPIIQWERANPTEKLMGMPGQPLEEVGENVAHLVLMGPDGEALIDAIDAALGKADQVRLVGELRAALRKDPTDALGTSGAVLSALPRMMADA